MARFVRFVLSVRDPESSVEQGAFKTAYELRDATDVALADRAILSDELTWFEAHLQTPVRFNRSTSKGFARRPAKGIAWFKDTATEHLARMHRIAAVLERYGHPLHLVTEARVGCVIYEDDHQVVTEPFSEARTR
jgi:hypothetical protein